MLESIISLVCPTMIWVLLTGLLTSICLAAEDGVDRLRRLHRIPCSHCAYATGCPFLKCTVHPHWAMTELAIDCLDFEPTHQVAILERSCKSSPSLLEQELL